MTYHFRGRRSAFAVTCAVGAALALPATGLADQPGAYDQPASVSISVTGKKVKNFAFNAYGSSNAGKPAFKYASFTLGRGGASSNESHTVSGSGGTVKLAKSLATGSWKASSGKTYRVKLRFRATAAAKRGKAPKNCKGGTPSSRAGTVSGSLRVNMGKYFKTVKLRRAKAFASRSPALTCTPLTGSVGGPTEGLYLSSGEQDSFSVNRYKGRVTENFFVTDGKVRRSLTASTKTASVFTASDDAKSASVKGIGGFSGSLAYTASTFYEGGSNGTATGDLTAKFATGKVKVAAAQGTASLSKPGFKPPPPPNQPPSADFSSYQSFDTPNTIEFNDGSYDSDGNVTARSWDFGDGTTSTEVNPTHTYAGPGDYTVTLTVTDNQGAQASRTRVVTVSST